MAEPVWQLDAVDLQGVHRPRLEGVSLSIEPGVTAVIGPSGAGKTSLLNLLVGFETPDGGRVTYTAPADGQGLSLFWVPANGGLWPHLTLRQHLETVTPTSAAPGRVDELLEAFDLADHVDIHPEQLSQGQRARLSVARALASDARVLVMDEPLAHVGDGHRGRCWSAIREQIERNGATLVFATHDAQVVLAEAERAICISQGRVDYHGNVETLYWRPPSPVAAKYLGEANWLTPEETAVWLDAQAAPGCYRPERLQLMPDESSPVQVRSSRFRGMVSEVELVHEVAAVTRRFFCLSGLRRFRAGERVALRLCLMLLMVALIGCGGGNEPTIPVSKVLYWSLPPDDSRAPAPRSLTLSPEGEVLVLDTAGRVLVFDDRGQLLRQWRMPESEVGKPEGVCVLYDGRIAVADTHYHRVVFFDRQGQVLSMMGEYGQGPGQFIYPVKVIQDPDHNIYVAEYGSNDRIQKFTPDGQFITAFGGFGTGPSQFQRPSGLAWHDGHIYVADAINNRIQKFTDEGQFIEVITEGEAAVGLHFPYDLALGPNGRLFTVEYGAGRLSVLSIDGRLLGRFGRSGAGEQELTTPWGLTVGKTGRVWIADTGNRRVVEVRP